ncbi:hypothetical protein A2567_03135 [Candidatus Azambacteria bacterium RIFOXYD1_FULL_42_11]|uniref:N-acetyltransferase domain-containing protein n=4 Tax=Candidatus Azamiibacteriota TaxID=1752741 RepID=A0A0G0ZBY2_9BACT|nr:MAG: hypothetical protein UV07_C0010G0010 [Candidatus Azambacteria bacterium GW2011_GWB1_42_17]KKS46154.1 MAG: hypothetical protein UV10_C0007G0010 [Candidatus Azambacteria bacterium GW2011_GWA1_42_19]KKS75729.1 MAG: hypothetical protein UV48_C0007G0004 [Candidatus Azambacteria bacterium GW2011_GWA2_42_9]KKS88498.1 MAG: hypothetical protein UV62_C0006G0009 [Parcubacteria group bacterium GW2011_GWC1_43_11]OGD42022.1 MAG: hypothetical protein A2567_03135 [Candidatus Azambacteria bacterium RIFO
MVKIRKINSKDLSSIIKIGKKINEFQISNTGIFWSRDQLARWTKSKNDICLIAEDHNNIVGFVLFACHLPTKKSTFENIWVDSAYRKKGIARHLIDRALKNLDKKNISYIMGFVSENNKEHLSFLKKVGFSVGNKGHWIDKLI